MIYIICKKGKLTFPVTPSEVGVKGGEGQYDDIEVLKQGVMPFFKGISLKEFAWSSFFPAKPTSYTEPTAINKTTGTLNPPRTIVGILTEIKDSGEVIQLFIPSLGISGKKVQIRQFEWWQEKPGDIEYTITMVEYREVRLAVKPNQQTLEQKKSQAQPAKSNPGRPPSKKSPPKPPPRKSKKQPRPPLYKTKTKSGQSYTPKRTPPPTKPTYIPKGREKEN
ncbi:hypothetical protein P4S83_18815 [Aneurinibacillus thermoaerophilus]|uniref:hypothetical protein n=1 Tax=Aneurinibacillus thermoaerophilus TaxID=143495 RepID=UPI002E209F53|nr:hypothetical protein [Aneurinibacillus thermoaerophilus]MED0766337.1 hypothetical protein [Aneurinibacillus thermoaerophilus]